MTRRAPDRVFSAAVMGTVASVHVHGPGAGSVRVEDAVNDAIARIRDDERVFSTFCDDSDISRLRRGEAVLEELDPRVEEVWAGCRRAREQSEGRFDAWWRGWFDPTGYVKGWSVDRAARGALRGLVRHRSVREENRVDAVGISVGGDMQLFTAESADRVWRVGIADPGDRERLLATVQLRDGAVATSGTGERPGHLVDPRSAAAVGAGVGASFVSESLCDADVWSTVAAVAGIDDLGWIDRAPAGFGLICDGTTVRRWGQGVELVTYRPAP